MSYQDAVIRDNPAGFWILDAPDISDDYSFGLISLSSGLRVFNNATIGSTAVYTDVLPICTGGTNSIRIDSTSTSKITITNNYEIFYGGSSTEWKRNESKSFNIEFWMSFDNIPTSTDVLSIGSNIKLNFSQNTAKLTLVDSNNKTYTARLDVDTYQSQFYVLITYDSRGMYFSINGEKSSVIVMDNTAYFKDTTAPNFVFGPATGTDYFVIDCIAFYKYLLNENQIKDHISRGLVDKNPNAYVLANNGGVYSPSNTDGQVSQKFLFNSKVNWNQGKTNNLIVSGNVLTVKEIKPLRMHNPTTAPSVETFTSSSFSTTNGDSAILNKFSNYYNPNSDTIACQVYVVSEASEKPFFSISGFSFGTLALIKPANSLTIGLEASGDAAVTAVSGTLTTGTWYDVKITFSADTVTLTVNSSSYSNTLTDGNVSLSDSTLYIGNYYGYDVNGNITSYSSSGQIKNFSIFEDGDTRLSSLANTGKLTAKLSSTLDISQYGEWTDLITIDSLTTITASKLYHDGTSKNISVYGSTDNSTWVRQAYSGDKAPELPLNTTGSPYYLKISIESVNSYETRPSISYLELITYETLNSFSIGKVFSVKEYSTGTTHSHTIKSRDFNMLSRDRNFGINFQKPINTSTDKPGMSIISSPEAYRTVEMWFRVDDNPGNSKNFLIDVGANAADLSYNASGVLSYSGAWSSVFINGQSYTSASKTLVVGEMYHFMGVLSSNQTVSTYLNAKNDYSTGHSYTTYGDICLYSDAKTLPFALKKFNMKLGINKYTVSDTNILIGQDSSTASSSSWRIYSSQSL